LQNALLAPSTVSGTATFFDTNAAEPYSTTILRVRTSLRAGRSGGLSREEEDRLIAEAFDDFYGF
jgi:hypothetical protein